MSESGEGLVSIDGISPLDAPNVPAKPPRRRREQLSLPEVWQRRQRRALLLFVLTCLSTWYVGAQIPELYRHDGSQLSQVELHKLRQAIPERLERGELTAGFGLWNGLTYSVAVMSILLAHEMGHYLQTRRYGVPATFPFFIPMPISPFGTMGAVILQGSGTANRKSMFDIAISGPLAGLVVAIPVLFFGIKGSAYVHFEGPRTGFGDPLLVSWLGAAIHGTPDPDTDLILTPLLFAGWVGVFITSLNLIPVGQLDGGHLLYCLIGKRAHDFALMVVGFAIAYCVFVDMSYLVVIVLLFLMGLKHPPTGDDSVPLGRGRRIAGWLTLAFIIVGFTPQPFMFEDGSSDKPARADYSDVDTEPKGARRSQ